MLRFSRPIWEGLHVHLHYALERGVRYINQWKSKFVQAIDLGNKVKLKSNRKGSRQTAGAHTRKEIAGVNVKVHLASRAAKIRK